MRRGRANGGPDQPEQPPEGDPQWDAGYLRDAGDQRTAGQPLDSGQPPRGRPDWWQNLGQRQSPAYSPPPDQDGDQDPWSGGRPYLPSGPRRSWPGYDAQDLEQPQPFGSAGRYPSPVEHRPSGQDWHDRPEDRRPADGPPARPDEPTRQIGPGSEVPRAAWPEGWTQPASQVPRAATGEPGPPEPRWPAGSDSGPEPAYSFPSPPGPPEPSPASAGRPRRRRRTILVLALVAALVAVAAAAGGGYLLLRTKGSPQQTATAFLSAWQQHDYRAMNKVTVGRPHGGVAGALTAASRQLGVRSLRLKLGRVTSTGANAKAGYTVTERLTSNHTWTYRGVLHLVNKNRTWWVRWSPSVIYPKLKAGERFVLSTAWPTRAPILGAGGAELSSPALQSESGSIALLTGYVGSVTKKQAKHLGPEFKPGDPIGVGGIEQAYQARLAGSPSLKISLVGPGKRDDGVVQKFAGVPGKPVQTSIKMSVQLAASQAVLAATTTKPIDMVVIQPSTGRVLAMVERPGSWDRAIDGVYPPGSTFKIVTASALAKQGMTQSSPVDCPSTVNIGGYVIHNDQNEELGSTTLLKAFAISCNTTFAELATQRLTGRTLEAMARQYGYNAKPALGIPAQLGSFKLPSDSTGLAANAFGQGTDLVSPLSQATEAAAAQNGTWRPPLLVLNPAPKQTAQPHTISPSILSTLRPMMHAVVTIGTAAGVGFPPGVYGKTGTAEYGTGTPPKAHGWFIGYDGNLAFAVLVEGGGFGASSAGPIANTFVHKIYG